MRGVLIDTALVTDSAAGASAWATGQKTYNGAVSVNLKGKPLPIVGEYAKAQGKATGLVTTALLTFFASWNEFFAALILITDQAKFTLPVTLTLVTSGQFGTVNWGALQAGVALTIVPCIVIYLLLQRYYVSGMLNGALK